MLRYPAHRYHTVPSPVFKPTTLWLRVRHPNHSATTLHKGVTLVIMGSITNHRAFDLGQVISIATFFEFESL
jgi:hypothetical protein